MKKKKLFTGLLLVSMAALAFTACGKKTTKTNKTTKAGDKTTKVTTKATTTQKVTTAKQTTKKDETISINHYLCDADTGIIAMDVQMKGDRLDYVNLLVSELNLMPISIKPIYENDEITKIKIQTMFSIPGGNSLYINTSNLNSKGVGLLTEYTLDDNVLTNEHDIMVKKSSNGAISLYNRYENITIDKKGVVTSKHMSNSNNRFVLNSAKVELKDGKYYIANKEAYAEYSLDPSNISTTMKTFNIYSGKYQNMAKIETDFTVDEPVVNFYSTHVYLANMLKIELKDKYGYNVNDEFIPIGTLSATFDNNGNVKKSTYNLDKYGVKSSVTTNFEFTGKNQLSQVVITLPDKLYRHQYSYDSNSRVSDYEYTIINADSTSSTEKKAKYEYNDFGYVTLLENEKNNTRYLYEYDTNTFLSSRKEQKKADGEWVDKYINTYVFENEIVTEFQHADCNSPINNYRIEYTIDGTKKIEKKYGKSTLDSPEYLKEETTRDIFEDTHGYYCDFRAEVTYNKNGEQTSTTTDKYFYFDSEHTCLNDHEKKVNNAEVLRDVYQYESYGLFDKKLVRHFTRSTEDSTVTCIDTTFTYDDNYKIQSVITAKKINDGDYDTLSKYEFDTDGNLRTYYDYLGYGKYDFLYYDGNLASEYDYFYDTENNRYVCYLCYNYGLDNPVVAVSELNYTYIGTTVIHDEYFYTPNVLSKIVERFEERTYANGGLLTDKKVETYYLNEDNSISERIITTYNSTSLVMTERKEKFNEDRTMEKTHYYESYDGEKIKEEWEKFYSGDTLTSGYKYTYTESGEKTSYHVDLNTGEWALDN